MSQQKKTVKKTDQAQIRAFHLDLKGVAFRPEYLPQLLADLASQRINAVLVEYEDIFPFQSIDIAFDPRVTWTPEVLISFQAGAKQYGIEVIPLQQCLGHLEYVFRWKQYHKFALDRSYPSTLDINNPKAKALIFAMLDEVIAAHPESRYIHVGMDEAHALVAHAQANGQDVVALFFDWLDELCTLCERHGKAPLIWSDMLEDHISPQSLKLFAKFKNRVVLCPWDYSSEGTRIKTGRIAGMRFSKEWLKEPTNPEAPGHGPGSLFTEDIPPAVRKLVDPYIKGRYFLPMFQADLWGGLGFLVLGASAALSSADGALLPFYNRHIENIRAWSRAIKRTGALGQIATAWARGTTFCPPNCRQEVLWPLIAEMSRSMGAEPQPFFEGIPEPTVERIVVLLGRSRDDWRMEEQIADEMRDLTPQLKTHHYEWRAIELMARLLALHRRAEFVLSEVDFFYAGQRLVEPEWQRRLDDQAAILKDMKALRREIDEHFGQRYHGDAYEEWLRHLFDLHVDRIKAARDLCRERLKKSRKVYG